MEEEKFSMAMTKRKPREMAIMPKKEIRKTEFSAEIIEQTRKMFL